MADLRAELKAMIVRRRAELARYETDVATCRQNIEQLQETMQMYLRFVREVKAQLEQLEALDGR